MQKRVTIGGQFHFRVEVQVDVEFVAIVAVVAHEAVPSRAAV